MEKTHWQNMSRGGDGSTLQEAAISRLRYEGALSLRVVGSIILESASSSHGERAKDRVLRKDWLENGCEGRHGTCTGGCLMEATSECSEGGSFHSLGDIPTSHFIASSIASHFRYKIVKTVNAPSTWLFKVRSRKR